MAIRPTVRIYIMGFDNPIHIAFLLLLLLLVFGAKRLPELGRSLGTGMRGFKDSLSGEVAQPQPPANQLVSNAAAVEQVPVVVPVADPSTHLASSDLSTHRA
jgi:sec-independent protein translocase protein TatA